MSAGMHGRTEPGNAERRVVAEAVAHRPEGARGLPGTFSPWKGPCLDSSARRADECCRIDFKERSARPPGGKQGREAVPFLPGTEVPGNDRAPSGRSSIVPVTSQAHVRSTHRSRHGVAQTPPLFLADWAPAVFMHYEADPDVLQREVPFSLDLRDGRAYVSLVAFTMRRLRPAKLSHLGSVLLTPIATHSFLNVRTYVRFRGEPGIYFMCEWLSNRLAVQLGPPTFGLPYRFGRLDYHNDGRGGRVSGTVSAVDGGHLCYRGELARRAQFVAIGCGMAKRSAAMPGGPHARACAWACHTRRDLAPADFPRAGLAPCLPGSLDEFLLEHYTAFTQRGPQRRRFRVDHAPWPQTRLDLTIDDAGLLRQSGAWIEHARLVGANFSPGVTDVSIGWPCRISSPSTEVLT